ncbi:FecCD family ABC transporter permease [Candidatus Methanoprimaticola sp. MG2]|uniref:FecCD family ABC transporter permease n=1 Tax=Candidatus Methanoprimaticola sp. MG2 TaxID=3228838 RepID=UPI0039C68ADC
MEDGSDRRVLEADYGKYTRRKVLFISACLIICFLAVGTSVTVGGRELSIIDVYRTIFNHLAGHDFIQGTTEWMDDYIVWNVRLPRAIFGIVAGAGLAVAGATMQSVMKNPLADPYTTGISSGACFGVAIVATLGISVMSGDSGLAPVVNAFVFALIPMLVIVLIAPRDGTSPATLILAGVAISFLFNAMTTIILTFTDSETLADVYEWQIGTLTNITWGSVPVPLVITILGTIAMTVLSRKLNIISLGDEQATSLGVSVERMRMVLLILISMIVASVVAYAGIIGFIGLIAPHIVRMLIDSDNRFVIPGSAMFGATFLLSCDIIVRMLSDVEAIPVGVVVSFVGAPIFLYLIVRRSKSMW